MQPLPVFISLSSLVLYQVKAVLVFLSFFQDHAVICIHVICAYNVHGICDLDAVDSNGLAFGPFPGFALWLGNFSMGATAWWRCLGVSSWSLPRNRASVMASAVSSASWPCRSRTTSAARAFCAGRKCGASACCFSRSSISSGVSNVSFFWYSPSF